jgi:hypothetical protein
MKHRSDTSVLQHSWKTVCGFNHSRETLVQTFGTPLRDAMRRLLDAAQATKPGGHSAEVNEVIVNDCLSNIAPSTSPITIAGTPFRTNRKFCRAPPAGLSDFGGDIEES